MEEIIEFIRNSPIRANVPVLSRNRQISYVVCNDLGSVYLIHTNGFMSRKANVQTHSDLRISRHNSIGILNEIDALSNKLLTIKIYDQASIHLMYCHRPVTIVNSNCEKILIYGNSRLVFDKGFPEPTNVRRDFSKKIVREPTISHKRCFDLLDKDQLEFVGSGQFYIRISSNQHYIFIDDSSRLQNDITYTSDYPDSHRNLLDLVANLDHN